MDLDVLTPYFPKDVAKIANDYYRFLRVNEAFIAPQDGEYIINSADRVKTDGILYSRPPPGELRKFHLLEGQRVDILAFFIRDPCWSVELITTIK